MDSSRENFSKVRVQTIYHQGAVKQARDEADCTISLVPCAAVSTGADNAQTPSTSGRDFDMTVSGFGNSVIFKGRGCQEDFKKHSNGSYVATLMGDADDGFCTLILHPDPQDGSIGSQNTPFAHAFTPTQRNCFDEKTDEGSSHMYFHYYGMLQHQQNMLQDSTRTGAYYWAIMQNRNDFDGKVVVDVGAGSGILSMFASQAGARKVYAVEASGIVQYARKLALANGAVGERVEVVHGKVETTTLPEKADVLISEPMGTLLVNERMLETYIYARKHFLKPGGKMFPSIGRIFAAAFQDDVLHTELSQKALFWTNSSFYGVSLTSLHDAAVEGYYNKVVVDSFDPGAITSTWAQHTIDFNTADESELADINIPLNLVCRGPGIVHGIACWFDVLFPGSTQPTWLSTAPGMPLTHWFQLRCVFRNPIRVFQDGSALTGTMRLVAHSRQSYDIHIDVTGPPIPGTKDPQTTSGIFDLKEPYYRQLSQWWPASADS